MIDNSNVDLSIMSAEDMKAMQEMMNKDFLQIVVELYSFFKDYDKVNAWLYTKNPHFGNIEPMQLMAVGREHKVLAFIKNAQEGNLP